MEAPIFIVGTGRSGTSLLRLILNAHSHIAIPPELTYVNRCPVGVDPSFSWRQPGFTEAQYEAFVRDFMAERVQGRVFDDATTQQLLSKILESEQRDLRHPYATVLEAYIRKHNKQRWGEKSPANLFYVDVLRDMFPEAKFILMVRDPRAGVCSMRNAPFFPDDVVFNALHRKHYATDGYPLLEKHTAPDRRITVRYEDLVSDPAAEVARLCDFLEEPFEAEMLAFHQDAEKYLQPLVYTPKLKRPISSASKEKWRQELTASAIGVIESICAEEMDQFAYEPLGMSPSVWDRGAVITKSLYWRVYRWRLGNRRVYRAPGRMFARSRTRLGNLFGRTAVP